MKVQRATELVLRWAIWDVRRRDIPADVAEALVVLAPIFPRADPQAPRTTPYSEGSYRLSVFPDNSGERQLYDSFPISPGRTLDEVLELEPAYVLLDTAAAAREPDADLDELFA